ncbi:MAG: MalM family protein [Rhodocyclaceae bacterium]|nr:MalM family protein [Rhodocyclaceae bacterium]
MSFLKHSSSWLAALMAFLLSGCGSVETRQKPGEFLSFEAHGSIPAGVTRQLADEPLCCTSLAGLPYKNLDRDGDLPESIGEGSPAFTFPGGKSYFAAYRLADLPRPAMIEVASKRTGEPGSLGRLVPDLRQLVFAPVVLILDEHFVVRRTVLPGEPLKDCKINPQMDVYRLHADIPEPANEAAYMVVLTTRDMLALENAEVCGVIRHGLSPIGDVTLRVTSLRFDDGLARLRSSWEWYPNAHGPEDVGLVAGMFKTPGLLIQGDRALHYFEWKDGRYAEGLSIPYGRLVSAKAITYAGTDSRYLVIGAREEHGGSTVHHTFLSRQTRGEPTASARTAADLLAQRIHPDAVVERIGFAVAETQPLAEFVSADHGMAARIGASAMAGGLGTAFPCGICQAGACAPDMLASCAALFSVGAILGGVVGVGSELLSAASGKNTPPPGSREKAARLTDAAKGWKFEPVALMRCLEQELGKKENAAWHDQGRKGIPSRMPPGLSGPEFPARVQAQGLQQGVEISVTRVALIPETKPGHALAEAPVHLLIEGQMRWAAMSGKDGKPSALSWKSASRNLEDWTQPGVATEILQQGCHGLAARIVDTSRKTWAQ